MSRRAPNARAAAALGRMKKRESLAISRPNLQCLVRIYFLDGSSKVLQMTDASTVADVLSQLKYNLDLNDISTCALFRVENASQTATGGARSRRLELGENIQECMKEGTNSNSLNNSSIGIEDNQKDPVRILFRTWIHAKCGVFESDVFQDLDLHKQSNSSLWLAYMEANFMCMTGRYYLSEDESLLLGCLRMQADSGDYRPEMHTLELIQVRIANHFPRPASITMRALLSPTLRGSGRAEAMAEKVMFLYARIAGKHKAEAQIDFLQTLRTWCPFYGATFFTVQCQLDDGSSDTEPPVVTMNVGVGPLAIFMLSVGGGGSGGGGILRHPYKRIVKWLAYTDKHIFSYWVIKPDLSLRHIEEAQAEFLQSNQSSGDGQAEFDATEFCDCVYLVTPLAGELEHLVSSYVQLLRTDVYPSLYWAPGTSEEVEEKYTDLQPPVPQDHIISKLGGTVDGVGSNSSGQEGIEEGEEEEGGESREAQAVQAHTPQIQKKEKKRRKSRIHKLFQALGGGVLGDSGSQSEGDMSSPSSDVDSGPENKRKGPGRSAAQKKRRSTFNISSMYIMGGTGIGADSGDESDGTNLNMGNGDLGTADSSISGSGKANLFNNVFASPYDKRKSGSGSGKHSGDSDADDVIPPQIQFAANMSEMQKLSSSRFSDDEGSEGEGGRSDSDEDITNHRHSNSNNKPRESHSYIANGGARIKGGGGSHHTGGNRGDDIPSPETKGTSIMKMLFGGSGKGGRGGGNDDDDETSSSEEDSD